MGLDICLYKVQGKTKNTKNLNEILYQTNFPVWTKKYVHTRESLVLDFDSFYENTGINLLADNVKQSKIYFDEDNNHHFIYNIDGNDIDVNMKVFPRKIKYDDIIFAKKIGYQRNGTNSLYFEDLNTGKISDFIWEKSILEDMKYKYFDSCEYYDLGISCRQFFQENIIDKFEDGKCFVFFA